MDDGSEVSGVTDKDGKAEPDLKSGGKVLFPDLSMPGDKSDEGDLRPYVVRQGDYLTKLAFAQGFDVDEVWNHPKNEEVKSLRKDHHILAPGDVLQVPVKKKEGMPIQKGGANPYQAKVPKVEVKLCLRRGTRLLRNEPYTVLGLEGDWSSTTTDGDGKLTLAVPVTVREVEVILTRAKLRFPILIGDWTPSPQTRAWPSGSATSATTACATTPRNGRGRWRGRCASSSGRAGSRRPETSTTPRAPRWGRTMVTEALHGW